jgi:hypothetical protein
MVVVLANPADVITENIRMEILQRARDHIKQNFKDKLIGLPCKKCNLLSSSVKDFSDDDTSVIAHLECTNCGFEDDFIISLSTEGLEEGLKSVNKGIGDLQKAIEDANRTINRC